MAFFVNIPSLAMVGSMAGFVGGAAQASLLMTSGWLLKEPASIPLWQLGLALILGAAAVAWMYLHEA